ncbi:MAG TPA: hypothetical protein VI953_04960 [Candidatus Paceibacterota bacterium]
MSNKTIVGVIVGLIVIGGLAWWGLSGRTEAPVDGDVAGDEISQPNSLTVNHYFDNGSHTIEGTITLPTPCHSLTSDVLVAESYPEQVTIKFTIAPGTGICTQVLADKFFRVTFNASKDASIKATLNGQPISLVYSENKEGITK